MNAKNLLDVLKGIDTSESSGYCNCDYHSNHPTYYDWERNIAKPALEALGYRCVVFADGERDSFGPLSRLVYAKKENERFTFYYN